MTNDNDANIFLLFFINKCGLNISCLENLNGYELERDQLLNKKKYEEIQFEIPELKKYLSSSMFTSVQKNANDQQKFPLINLVRQILKRMGFYLTPKRICNGYDENGKKKYKRLFRIQSIESSTQKEKIISTSLSDL